MKRTSSMRHRRTLSIEPVEPRIMLAGDSVEISEFMVANVGGLSTRTRDNTNGRFSGDDVPHDWIELKNLTDAAVDLSGFHLSDDRNEPGKWEFPEGTQIPAEGYIIVFASKLDVTDPALDEQGNLHTNFKLSLEGEYLGLTAPDESLVDQYAVTYPRQFPGISFGIDDLGQSGYLTSASPGGVNGSSFLGAVAGTNVDVERGFYDEPFEVAIATETQGAVIRYTTDGSLPSSTHGEIYQTPVQIESTTNLRAAAFKDGYVPAPVETNTYIFVEQVTHQTNEHVPNGQYVFWSTEMDREIVDDPAYRDIVDNSLMSLPTLSITLEWEDVFGITGIHRGQNLMEGSGGNAGAPNHPDWVEEQDASVELIYPDGVGSGDFQGFHINAGIRIQGGGGRWQDGNYDHKQSFGLRFREDYGASQLDYPFFESAQFNADSAVDSFDALILRAGHNKSWSANWDREPTVFARDQLGRDLQLAMSGIGSHGTYMHLYINGIYWGLYNPTERADGNFTSSYLGGDDEGWYSGKAKGGTVSGDASRFNEWRSTISKTEDFALLQEYVAVDEYIDMALTNVYADVGDFPQYYYGNRNDVPGPVYFFNWYQEDAFGGGSRRTSPNPNVGLLGSIAAFDKMWENNEELRRRFADRAYRAGLYGGWLSDEGVLSLWDGLTDQIYEAVVAESARWGDEIDSQPNRRDDEWESARQAVRDDLIGRGDRLINALRDTMRRGFPLYPSIDPGVFNQFGGPVSAGFEVTMHSTPSVVSEELVLTTQGDDMVSFVPTDNSLETGIGPFWYDPDFEPNGWIEGTNGVGFDDETTFDDLIGTDVGAEWNAQPSSVYGRIEFDLDADFDADVVTELNLRMKYDDGFVAYLNGQMVAFDRAPSPPAWDSKATGARIDILSTFFFKVDISEHASLLQPGRNVLAIQGLNRTTTDDDLLVLPQLELTRNVALGSPPIYFTTNGEDPRLLGGQLNPAAQVFTAPVVIDETTEIRARTMSNELWSALTSTTFVVTPSGGGIVISELNYNPHAPTESEQLAIPGIGNDDFEFVELLNSNPTEPVNLLGMHFTDGIGFSFGNATLGPGERGVIVRDLAAFTERYENGLNVLGTYEGSLANGGERIELVDAADTIIASFEYNDADPWPSAADGVGSTLEFIGSAGAPYDKYSSWRGSTDFGGSPGTVGADAIGVVINEVLTNTELPSIDAIELLNTSSSAVDISGWFLSDATGSLQKFRIPDGTVLDAGAYRVFNETHFNPTPDTPGPVDFALDGNGGDDVYLTVPDANGGIQQIADDVHFGAAAVGESFGRVPNGSGRLAPMMQTTLGEANNGARVGPLVISELNYAPGAPSAAALAEDENMTSNDLEFVEVHNPTAAVVEMGSWRIQGGVDFEFDATTSLEAGETVVILSFDPNNPNNASRLAAFRAHYGLEESMRLLGGYGGQLNNLDERVQLQRPGTPPLDEPLFIPYLIEDEVLYESSAPWPDTSGGDTLQRRDPNSYGNAAVSWTGSTPTLGSVSFDVGIPGDFNGDQAVDALDIELLNTAVHTGVGGDEYDLDGNSTVDSLDVAFLVEDILQTFMGDTNLDGKVDPVDLNAIGVNWLSNAGWAGGDFTGDGVVSPRDLNVVGINWLQGVVAAAQLAGPKRVPRAPFFAADAAVKALAVDEAMAEVEIEQSVSWLRETIRCETSTRIVETYNGRPTVKPYRGWQSFARRAEGDNSAVESDADRAVLVDEMLAILVPHLRLHSARCRAPNCRTWDAESLSCGGKSRYPKVNEAI